MRDYFVVKFGILLGMAKSNIIIGIDEVGRGPIAGPVTVGVVRMDMSSDIAKKMKNLLRHQIGNFKDSKQLSPEERKDIYQQMVQAQKDGELNFFVTSVNSSIIDEQGLSYALLSAITRLLRKFDDDPEKVQIVLDGKLSAPEKFVHQQTVIKGDTIHLAIALASIVAKVTRDKYMIKQDKVFPEYGFKKHKGYGTIEHRKAIKKYGLCPLHRKSFCKKT